MNAKSSNNFLFRTAAALAIVLLALAALPATPAYAAACASNASGNWNAAGTWTGCGGGVPGAADTVTIQNGHTVTVTANASVSSITFSETSTSTGTITVNSGVTLTVTNGITLRNDNNSNTSAALSGAGAISAASVTVGGNTTPTADGTTTLTSTISTLSLTGNLSLTGLDSGSNDNDPTFNLQSGSVSAGGSVVLNEPTGSAVTLTLASNPQTGTLTLSGATPFTITGSPTFTANGTSATVVYSGAAQTVQAVAYRNLTLTGSGDKSMASGTSVNGTLSIAPTGSAKANIATGQNLTVNSLTLGGLGRINGTWGSTTSSATNQNNTYFAATTGFVTVSTDTRSTPTVNTWPTASGITYGQALSASTLTGGSASVTGSFAFTTPATEPNAGTFSAPVTFTPADLTSYKTVAGNVNVAVAKANAVIVVTPYSVTYDAASHTSTGTATGVHAEVLSGLNLTGTTHTNAGTYNNDPWTFTAPNGNYNDASGTVNNSIAKANAVIVVTPYSVTYDSTAHTAAGTATGVGGDGALTGLNLSGTTHTNAGTYGTDPWSFTDVTGNYNNDSGTVSNSIAKADAVIVVTPYSVTYDATAHTAAGTATGVGGDGVLTGLNLSGTTHTNAGTYNNDPWTFTAPNGNYNNDSGTVNNAIAKADATIVVTPYSVTYNGSAHTATGTAKGVNNEALGGLDLSGTTHTNAGTYGSDPWTFTAPNGNYNDDSGTVSDSIAKANAVIAVTPYSVTYDGSAHTSAGTATGVNDENLGGLNLSGTTHTNAGTYNNDPWTFTAPNANYNNDSGTVDNSIAKANALIVVTPYSVTYDGSAHTATGTATGVNAEDLSAVLDLSGTTHTSAGTYGTDPWTFTDVTGNYNNDSGTVSDSIAKANAVIVVTPYSVTYNGSAHISTGTATGVNAEVLSAGLDLSGTIHTNAGTYGTDPWTFTAPNGNYNNDSGMVSNSIAKASAVIVVTPYSVTYDATAHTATGTATGVNAEDLSAGLDLSGTAHTNAGTYAADPWVFTAPNGNYNDDSGTVSDNITTLGLTISGLTANNKVYDGGTTATLSGTAVLNGILGGDTVNLGGTASASFADADVGTGKPVSVSGYTVDNGNYSVSQPAGLTADITPKAITVTANNQSKVVGDPDPDFTFTASGFVGLDTFVTNPVCAVSVPHALPNTYPIVCSGAVVGSNYSLDPYVDGTLTVNAFITDANMDVYIGGALQEQYVIPPSASLRDSYPNVNAGPVKLISTNSVKILAAERLIYKVNNVATSFSEMMGLPNNQLDNVYWLPWYNNVELDTQLRFANVTGSTAAVHVFIGNTEMTGSPFTLLAGASTRKSFAGVNAGPVRIVSDQNIVAAERLIYKANGVDTSFSEMMALPNSQLDTTYWLPWYNNVELDTQLRFANVTNSTATVHVYIGNSEMTGSPFTLLAGASTRKSFAGVNAGPVRIVSDQNIVAAERLIYKVNNVATSFSEMMALPNSQLNTTYWLPWYNNVELDTQLRFANTTNSTATVHVYIGGVEMQGSPFTLLAGASTRKSFLNINAGPVKIVSDVPIVAAERLIYKVNNVPTSFSEMMALPNGQLDSIYWLPWYNNKDLDTQLRFGVP